MAAGIERFLVAPFGRDACLLSLHLAMPSPTGLAQVSTPCSPGSRPIQPSGERLCAKLTAEEERVMASSAEGLLYKEVAERLRLSQAKVKRVQHRAYGKLGAHKAVEAVDRWRAIKAGG